MGTTIFITIVILVVYGVLDALRLKKSQANYFESDESPKDRVSPPLNPRERHSSLPSYNERDKINESFPLTDPLTECYEVYSKRDEYRYRIQYVDEKGDATNRSVLLHRVFVNNGRYYFEAFCEMRREMRSFHDDRVLKAVHISSRTNVESICEDVLQKWRRTPDGLAESFVKTKQAEIVVLSFVSHANGGLSRHALQVICDHVLKSNISAVYGEDRIRTSIEVLVSQFRINDIRDFRKAIRKIQVSRIPELLDSARHLIGTGKRGRPLAIGAIETLEGTLKRSRRRK